MFTLCSCLVSRQMLGARIFQQETTLICPSPWKLGAARNSMTRAEESKLAPWGQTSMLCWWFSAFEVLFILFYLWLPRYLCRLTSWGRFQQNIKERHKFPSLLSLHPALSKVTKETIIKSMSIKWCYHVQYKTPPILQCHFLFKPLGALCTNPVNSIRGK